MKFLKIIYSIFLLPKVHCTCRNKEWPAVIREWLCDIWLLSAKMFPIVCMCGRLACGILGPQPEIEAMPPALEGEVFTTRTPGRLLFPMLIRTDTIRPSAVAQSCPTLCDPMDCVAYQAPPSMGFSNPPTCMWISLIVPVALITLCWLILALTAEKVMELERSVTQPGIQIFSLWFCFVTRNTSLTHSARCPYHPIQVFSMEDF